MTSILVVGSERVNIKSRCLQDVDFYKYLEFQIFETADLYRYKFLKLLIFIGIFRHVIDIACFCLIKQHLYSITKASYYLLQREKKRKIFQNNKKKIILHLTPFQERK